MRRQRRSSWFAAALGLWLLASPVAATQTQAQDLGPTIDLKPGQEVTFAATVVEGRVTLGAPQIARLGSTQTRPGEITVGLAPGGLSPYAKATIVEKTAAPIDFYATGFIDRIKIDEVRFCGDPGAASAARIAAGSRRVSLNRFEARPEGAICR